MRLFTLFGALIGLLIAAVASPPRRPSTGGITDATWVPNLSGASPAVAPRPATAPPTPVVPPTHPGSVIPSTPALTREDAEKIAAKFEELRHSIGSCADQSLRVLKELRRGHGDQLAAFFAAK